MRDLLFKNLTSTQRKRKVLSCSEVNDSEGVRSTIRRHFVYVVKEIAEKTADQPAPSLRIIKERNTLQKKERFFCKMKGTMVVAYETRLFEIRFMHSLYINLIPTPNSALLG